MGISTSPGPCGFSPLVLSHFPHCRAPVPSLFRLPAVIAHTRAYLCLYFHTSFKPKPAWFLVNIIHYEVLHSVCLRFLLDNCWLVLGIGSESPPPPRGISMEFSLSGRGMPSNLLGLPLQHRLSQTVARERTVDKKDS